MKSVIAFTMCCVSAALATGTPAQAGDAADRFIADYAPHAEELRAFYTGREVRYRSVVPTTSPNARQQEDLITVRYDYENFVLTDEGSTFTSAKAGEAPIKTAPGVYCRNKQYYFQLDRKESVYAIRKVTIFPATGIDRNYEGLCQLCFPFADPFLRMTYLQMATDPDHEVLRYDNAIWRDGRPVKELELKRSYIRRATGERASYIVSFFFDAQSGWVCVGNRVHSGKSESTSGEVFEYEPTGEGLPAIKHWEAWDKAKNGPEIRKWYYDVLFFRRAVDFSESECRLSAFGIPEPVGLVREKRTPRYVWYLLAAGVFAALMIGFRYLARRPKTSGS